MTFETEGSIGPTSRVDNAVAAIDIQRVATPSMNDTLQQRLAGFSTLAEALDYAALGETGFNFYSLRGELSQTLPYSKLRERALDLAQRLASRFERGSRLCLVAETSVDFVTTFFACQYAGIVPAPMPMPVNLGGKNGYITQIRQMMVSADASVAICPASLEDFVTQAANSIDGKLVDVFTYSELFALSSADEAPVPFGPDELCYIQYSSGSTSAPKGVIGTQASVNNNLTSIVRDGLKLNPGDRAASWLPLYHDMGLIGFVLTPMTSQTSVDMIATSDFVRRPLLWLSLIAKNRCTITYSPSFGYELASKRARRADSADIDLTSLRVAGIGGDMVRPEALNAFRDRFISSGFNPNAFTPSYGMAEATLAIAFTDTEEAFCVDHVDMRHYNRSGIAQPVSAVTSEEHKRSFVKCGQVLPGHNLEVRNEDGTCIRDREVGRIFIKGPSLTPGYFSDEEASRAMFDGEWLDTGDMGYTLNGDIFITGRAKDLIIINGRNIWPQDIEWAVEEVDHVRQGGVAAFSIDNGSGERIVAIVECRGGLTDTAREELRRNVMQVIQTTAGSPAEVKLVRPHSMVMTSSGKLSRAKVREKYLQGAFDAAPEPALANSLG